MRCRHACPPPAARGRRSVLLFPHELKPVLFVPLVSRGHGRLSVCNVWSRVSAGSQLPPDAAGGDEANDRSDAMPNISDLMLRKLKLHRGLPGWWVTSRLQLH